MRPHSKQQGYILLPVVIIITLVAIVAFMMNVESTLETGSASAERESDQVRYVAEAGLQHAQWAMQQAGCGPYTDIVGEAFGDHSYDATITPNHVAGTLNTIIVPVSDDAYVKQDTPTQNYGNDAQLQVWGEMSRDRHALYRFDIDNAGIPVGATVVSAVFKIFVIDPDISKVDIYPLEVGWSESTVTWNDVWDKYDGSSPMASLPDNPPAGAYLDVNLTALVQGWINGGIDNEGIIIDTTGTSDLSQYTSKEYGNVNQRPYLEVITKDGFVSTRADISATGILANGMEQTLTREAVVLYQPPSHDIHWQHDASLGVDAEIWDRQPDKNYGGETVTWVSSASNDKTRSLLHFDMGAIPAGAGILEATLSLYRKSGSGSDQPVSAHRIMNSWSEDAVTWESRETGTKWDTAGVDFDLTAVATTPVGPDNRRYEWNITPLVQGWVDGSYPNYGVVLAAAIDGMPGEEFFTSDHTTPSQRPNLSIAYACECGTASMAPQGTGNILAVVHDPGNLAVGEEVILRLFETWGYTYTLIKDDKSQDDFDAAMATHDVVFVSESVDSDKVGIKLTHTHIGVVCAENSLNDELGISTDGSFVVGQTLIVMDTSHEITQIFPVGSLQFKRADMAMNTVGGTLAPGAQVLAEFGGVGALVVLDTGAEMAGGGNTAGRRVAVPLGYGHFAPNLTNNGQLILQRAIEWAKPISCGDGDYRDNFDSEAFSNNDGSLTWGSDWTEVDGDGPGPASGNVIIRSGRLVLDDDPDTGGQPSAARTLNLLGANKALLDFDFELGKDTDQTDDVAILEISIDGSTWDVLMDFSVYDGTAAGHRQYDLSAYLVADVQIRFRIEAGYGSDNENLQIDNLVVSVCGTLEDSASTGPIAHWKLDETSGTTAQDIEGGHDGDLISGPVWMPGKIDGGLSFDGSDDYVNVPHQDTLSLNNFTISAWVNATALNGYRIVVSKGTAANLNYYLGTHDNEITFGFLNVGVWQEFETTGAGLAINNWYHLAGTFDDTIGEAKMYLNGVLLHTATTTASPPACNDDLMIGTTIFNEFWSGLLDDVRIYDRVLGGSDIADIADAGSPPPNDVEYVDQFNALAYNGSDGSLDWSISPWTEISDDGAPDSGNIRVLSGLLELTNLDGGDFEGAVRGADLSIGSPATAVLSFEFGGSGAVSSDDSIMVAVSDNGGSAWVVLEEISVAGEAYGSRSYDLHDSIALSNDFQFKVQILRGLDGFGNYVYLDNVTIDLDAVTGSGCNGSYTDAFITSTFSGSDGALTWTGDWLEVGEDDGAMAGDIGIYYDMGFFKLRLRDNDNMGEGVEREADLSAAGSAQLTFSYRREGLDSVDDNVRVEISANGVAGPWTEIARLEGPGTDAVFKPFSIDISSYAAANTRIRFITSPSMGDRDTVWLDNVSLTCSP
jgi:Concanavalin A-like lectin/glucanases superfamily/Disaggregatase related repeat